LRRADSPQLDSTLPPASRKTAAALAGLPSLARCAAIPGGIQAEIFFQQPCQKRTPRFVHLSETNNTVPKPGSKA
jgi:hypothetical protein